MQAVRLRERVRACRDELAQVMGAARDLQRGEEDRFAGRYGPSGGYERTAGGFGGWRAADGGAAQRIERAADRCMYLLTEIEREADEVEAGFRGPMAESRPYGGSRDFGGSSRGARYYPNSTFGRAAEEEMGAYAPASGAWTSREQAGLSWGDGSRYRYETPPSSRWAATSAGAWQRGGEPMATAGSMASRY